MEGSCFDGSEFVADVAAVDPADSIRVDAETCSLLECSLSQIYLQHVNIYTSASDVILMYVL